MQTSSAFRTPQQGEETAPITFWFWTAWPVQNKPAKCQKNLKFLGNFRFFKKFQVLHTLVPMSVNKKLLSQLEVSKMVMMIISPETLQTTNTSFIVCNVPHILWISVVRSRVAPKLVWFLSRGMHLYSLSFWSLLLTFVVIALVLQVNFYKPKPIQDFKFGNDVDRCCQVVTGRQHFMC